MKWKTIKIGDCCTKIGSGSTPKGGSSVYKEDGVSFIRSQNVHNLEFDYDGLAHIDEKTAKKLNNVSIEENDVLLNITGDSVARTCVVPRNILPARVNQHVSIIRTKRQVINPLYLNFYLASPSMQSYMLGLAFGKGSSRNALTKQIIENFEISCPPIKIQESIASILSHYDDLIEINKRRIALLEESARELYKEWFVRMRFPNYEKVHFVEGKPEDWDLVNLTDIIEIRYGKDHKALEDGNIPCYGSGGIMRYVESQLYNGECVLIPRKGTLNNIMWVNGPFWTIDTMFYGIPMKEHVAKLVFFYLSSLNMEMFNAGAALPSMTTKILSKLSFPLPPMDIRNAFENKLGDIFSLVKTLTKYNEFLSLQRDRLLPRLMSGQLEV